MCHLCQPTLSRRHLLGGLAASFAALAGPASAASPMQTPPKPGNVLSPEDALKRLLAGNERYFQGKTTQHSFAASREALIAGQNPYATILGCADSRVSPELAFDEGQGDLFVTRVAGNFVTPTILASIEYGVAVLKTPLIFVLGHTNCGAIGAAVKAVTENASFPGHIQSLATDLSLSVRKAKKAGAKDLAMAATIENVRINVDKLAASTPILRRAVREGSLKVVGGVYQLQTGRVERVV